jgi:chromosome segregation ATPase
MTASTRNRSAEADASRLDRRREKLQARQLEADVASQTLSKYAEALESNSTRVSQLEADVATTRDRLAVLKKSLKNARKERDKLRNGRKKIRQNSAKAQQRATNAERKYDRAMLADMLER